MTMLNEVSAEERHKMADEITHYIDKEFRLWGIDKSYGQRNVNDRDVAASRIFPAPLWEAFTVL